MKKHRIDACADQAWPREDGTFVRVVWVGILLVQYLQRDGRAIY